jgi:hypothetical protein
MPHAVGKRIPRVPVASMYHRNDKICPANTQAKSDGTNGDDKGAHVAVLALAAPQASQIPGRSSDRMFLSPVIKLYSAVFFNYRIYHKKWQIVLQQDGQCVEFLLMCMYSTVFSR